MPVIDATDQATWTGPTDVPGKCGRFLSRREKVARSRR